MRNLQELDVTSLGSTVNVLSKGDENMPIEAFKLDQAKFEQIETQIISQFDLFLNQDISVVVAALIRLGFPPGKVLTRINRMNQLGTFNKD